MNFAKSCFMCIFFLEQTFRKFYYERILLSLAMCAYTLFHFALFFFLIL